MSQLLYRSLMFVPAHNERLMASAARTQADVLLLDLEDSVQPRENKQIARDSILRNIESGVLDSRTIFPRVNDRESGELLKDLQQLTVSGVDGFVYPKSETGKDIYFLDRLLETIEYEKGFPVGTFKIIPLIETAGAVLNAADICSASKRVVAIAFGCEDYITDIEGVHDLEGESIATARAMVAMAARSQGVVPIDTVHIRVHDLEHLELNLAYAKKLGFEGMLVLNPKEIPLVHKYYSPSKAEVESAQEMLLLSDEAEKKGAGVAVVNGKFIGPPMVKAAKKLLLKNKLINERDR
jgi:citrate lyase subunit beta/citryl-CoA lyase